MITYYLTLEATEEEFARFKSELFRNKVHIIKVYEEDANTDDTRIYHYSLQGDWDSYSAMSELTLSRAYKIQSLEHFED